MIFKRTDLRGTVTLANFTLFRVLLDFWSQPLVKHRIWRREIVIRKG